MQFDRSICKMTDEQTIDDVDFCYESKPFNDWCISCVYDQRIWYAEEMDGGMFSGREGLKHVPNWIYQRSGKNNLQGHVKWQKWGGSQKDILLFAEMMNERGIKKW